MTPREVCLAIIAGCLGFWLGLWIASESLLGRRPRVVQRIGRILGKVQHGR